MNVFLVTKLHTTNIGNQALSEEIINLVAAHVGAQNLYVAGRPIGLYSYDYKQISSSENPAALLDKWADEVIAKFKRLQKSVQFKSDIKKVKMVTMSDSKLKYEPLKVILRPLKAKLDKFKLFDERYALRLAHIASADCFIYSGAGEVGDNTVFLRQLLELRIAQKMGKKTGVVNQSIVVKTAAFKKLLKHVYGSCDKIVVRGSVSRTLLENLHVDEKIIATAPDTAIKTDSKIDGIKKSAVGINFTPLINFKIENIAPIIEKLKSYGNEIYFITNEPYGDREIGELLSQKYGITALEDDSDYLKYSAHLSQFKYIISTRLHSIILSLAAHTPAIPIEGNVFKTTELLSQLRYPIEVINAYKDGWENELISEIEKLETGSTYNFENYFDIELPKLKEDVQKNISWLSEVKSAVI